MTHINTATGKPELESHEVNALANALRKNSPIGVNNEVEALKAPIAEMIQRAVVEVRRQAWKAVLPADIAEERSRIIGLAQALTYIYREGAGHDLRYFSQQLDDLVREGWQARNQMAYDPTPDENHVKEFHPLRMKDSRREGLTPQQEGLTKEQEEERNALFVRYIVKPEPDMPDGMTLADGKTLPKDVAGPRETPFGAPNCTCTRDRCRPSCEACDKVGLTHCYGYPHNKLFPHKGDDDDQREMSLADMSKQDRASEADLRRRVVDGAKAWGMKPSQARADLVDLIIAALMAE